MTLYQQSRYTDATSNDVLLDAGRGETVRTLYRRPSFSGSYSIQYHIWRAGDRIDRLAHAYLNDPAKYWVILDLNPEILDAHNIEPGTRIRVPIA